jgi:hypothetical protein
MSLRDYAELLADPSSAVLVGAGASAPAGLPTWRTLLERIADALEPALGNAVRSQTAKDRYLEAAEIARQGFDSQEDWNRLLDPYDTRGVVTSTWNLVHSLGFTKIVTTNWDNIPRDSFAKVWQRAATEYIGPLSGIQAVRSSYPHIVYAHGKAPQWNSIVFTRSSYASAEDDDRYRAFWVDLVTKRPLLIVCFSGLDPAFQRVLTYVRDVLGIAHLASPVVIHPRSAPLDRFGPRALSLEYDDSAGHEPLAELLRNLRDALSTARTHKGLDTNPLRRSGIPALDLASRDSLLFALIGVDFRLHCSSESLLALVSLVQQAAAGTNATIDTIAEATAERMRVSLVEARDAAENAVSVAKSFGWITTDAVAIKPTTLLPRPHIDSLAPLVEAVFRKAQGSIRWTMTAAARRYIQDAILAYYGATAGRSAASVMGLDIGGDTTARQLRTALSAKGLAIGTTGIEQQVCDAVVYLLDSVPPELTEICGKLSSFAFAAELASLSKGRELLSGHGDPERVYFDTNVVLPAIAPGHRWHSRCAALIEKCTRYVPRNLILDGFIEELHLQFIDALSLAGEEPDPGRFYWLAATHDRPNGFLEGFLGWAGDRTSDASFQHYCAAYGLSRDVALRVQGLGLQIVRAPKVHGRFAEAHSTVMFGMSRDDRNTELGRHEADQVVLILSENHGHHDFPLSRFVTAHMKLRNFLVAKFPEASSAFVPPVAMSQLIATVHPSEIPPASLRELAFSSPGLIVTEAVFGMLIHRTRHDVTKLRTLASEEVAEMVRTRVRDVSQRFSDTRGIDARRHLVEVISREVIPDIEHRLASISEDAPQVLGIPTASEALYGAAKRMAQELQELNEGEDA